MLDQTGVSAVRQASHSGLFETSRDSISCTVVYLGAQSEVYVMSDQISTDVGEFNHLPGGANVLYMDGHVEFIRYPTKAPVNRRNANLFGRI